MNIKNVDTLIFSRRISFCLKGWINIFSMINIIFLICLPSNTKCFSFLYLSSFLIKIINTISIRCWFFFSISQYNFRDRLFLSFSKCTWFWWFSSRYLWLNNIRILYFIIFKSSIFRKWIFMWCISPCCYRLIPLWCILL